MDETHVFATESVENPAAAADAEQHLLQEVAGLRSDARRTGLATGSAALAAVACAWLLARRRRRTGRR